MLKAAAVAATIATLLAASPASASVRLVSLTSPASPGRYATLVVRVSPPKVTCTIAVLYKSGPSSAHGLNARRPSSSGLVRWSWLVGTRTTAGRWPIVVNCGASGALRTAFAVG